MTFEEAKSTFFISRKARNLSKNSIIWYNRALMKLEDYFLKNNLKKISDIKAHDIELLTNELIGTMRDVTIKDYFLVWRIFFTYLFEEEYLERNPMRYLKPPKVAQKIMRTFTKQEITKMLKSFDTNDFLSLRNYLILCLFFSTGMRKSELLGLWLNDINLTVDMLKVTGKGNKERLIPIGKTLKRVINRYLNEREDYMKDSLCDYFIVSRTKTKLAETGINLIFHHLKIELKIPGERVSAHSFRHTFAKTFLLNGGDLFSLQKIMGHSSINTTKKYVNLNDKEMKMQYAKYNPLDNVDWTI